MSSVEGTGVGTDRAKKATEGVRLGDEPLDMDIGRTRCRIVITLMQRRSLSEEAATTFAQVSSPDSNPSVTRYLLFGIAQGLGISVVRKGDPEE